MNEKFLEFSHQGIKQFSSLYTHTSRNGDPSSQTKELSNLVASTDFQRHDCISYHLEQFAKNCSATNALLEAIKTALKAYESSALHHNAENTLKISEAEGAH